MRGSRLRMCLFWMWPMLGAISMGSMWLWSGIRERQRICFLCGASLGLVAGLALIAAYISVPRESTLRRHPQPLIFWRVCADCYVAIHFLVYAIRESHECNNRMVFPLEFAMIASELWYAVSVHDIHCSIHFPFYSKKTLMKKYHWIVWVTSVFMGTLVSLHKHWKGAYYVGGGAQSSLRSYCWFNHKLLWPSWAFLYIPVIILYFGCFFITVINLYGVWSRITHHNKTAALSRVFAEHLHVLAINNANLVAVALYWALFGGSYVTSYLLVPRTTNFKGPSKNFEEIGSLRNFFGYGASYLAAFLLPCKGCVDFMVWLLPLEPAEFALGLGLSFCLDKQEPNTKVLSTSSTYMSDELRNALAAEIFAYIQVGIVANAQMNASSTFDLEPVVVGTLSEQNNSSQQLEIDSFITFVCLALSPTSQHRDRLRELCCLDFDSECNGRKLEARVIHKSTVENYRESIDVTRTNTSAWQHRIQFKSYCTDDFSRVRACYGISPEEYAESWRNITKARFNDGASGAFFIYSADSRFIAKTTTRAELIALRSRAKAYADYCCHSSGNSRLCRLLGAHTLVLYGRKFSFLVQENLFYATPSFESLRIYDVKGSFVNRHAKQPVNGERVNCKHCNQSYIFQRSRPILRTATRRRASCGGSNEEPLLTHQFSHEDDTDLEQDTACFFSRRGHEPNIAGKDEDLNETLQLDPETALRLICTLEKDTAFLARHGLMDYSLLIGVGVREYDVQKLGHNRSLNHTNQLLPQSQACRYDATVAIGPSSYTIAIIDLLQEYNYSKRMERCFKVCCRCQHRLGISVIDPIRYQDRFMDRIYDIIPIRYSQGSDRSSSFAPSLPAIPQDNDDEEKKEDIIIKN